MTDPHLGKLTYARVYSGQLKAGSQVLNSTKDRKERVGRILQMHANHREDRDAAFAGDIVALVGLKQTTTGRHPLRRQRPDRARVARLPRAGHPRGRRAQDQERPGQAVPGPPGPLRGGPHLPGALRRGDRPDRHRRHGRAAPRGAGGPHAAGVQGRRQRGQAPGGLPGDDQEPGAEGRDPLRPPDRRPRPVRPRRPQPGAHRPRRRLRVRRQDHRRDHPQGVHPLRRRRHPGRHAVRCAGRLPAGGHPGHPGVRLLPRRRQLGDGVQDRRLDVLQGGLPARPTRSCSSRSCPSRWSPPRTTWAT